MIENTQSSSSPDRSQVTQWLTWSSLLVIVLLAVTLRWRLVDVPLERDEGEYAYAGQLILNGIPPYQQVYNMKLPGIYAAYAVVLALFGQTHTGIHQALAVINAATIVLVFLLARRLLNGFAGVVAAACFALLSVSITVQGVFANAEHFVIPPALGGMILLLRAIDTKSRIVLVLSGSLMGLSFVVKQHGLAFVAFAAFYLLVELLQRQPCRWRRITLDCTIYGLALAFPYLLTCLIMAGTGVFENFWFWTFHYARAYTGQVSIYRAPGVFSENGMAVTRTAPLIWMLSAVGLSALIWDQQVRKNWMFHMLFVMFSVLAICPGFFFRPHYFVLTLPVAAILAGAGASALADLFAENRMPQLGCIVASLIVIGCLSQGVMRQRAYLFAWSPRQVARAVHSVNPFPESLQIASYLEANTMPSDHIAILGSEPQICFYADRRSATGYIYMYPLMESHGFAVGMQEEMIREIEAKAPKFVVVVNVPFSWSTGPESPRQVFRWWDEYRKGYRISMLVDLRPTGTRVFKGAELAALNQRPPMSVEIYQRIKSAAGEGSENGL